MPRSDHGDTEPVPQIGAELSDVTRSVMDNVGERFEHAVIRRCRHGNKSNPGMFDPERAAPDGARARPCSVTRVAPPAYA